MLAGCTQEPRGTGYVAKVGERTLTAADLPPGVEHGGDDLRREVVNTWVASELLYQEAERKNLGGSDAVQRQIDEARRQLLINALLEQEVYGDDSSSISQRDVETEFRTNADAYRLNEDLAQISYVLFDERDDANIFRSRVLRGASWDEALQDAGETVVRSATKRYFTQELLFPEELWKIARTLTKGDVSYAVRTAAGYCIAIVHETRRQGEVPPLEYARSEIRHRLLITKRRKKYDDLLASLRKKYSIDIRLAETDSVAERDQ